MAENNTSNIGFEKQIWDAACVLRGNIDASEYKSVVLGLIFLKYISDRFEAKYKELVEEGDGFEEDQDEYTAENIFFVPENARWSAIAAAAHTPEIGTVIDDAMRSIEKENKRLKDILPKNFARPELDKRRLGEVVDLFTNIQMIEHGNSKDILGRTYEYCLSKFAEQEGKLAGEFYTPSCVVRTLVEVLQPFNGRVYDPCCGSGGMFVQSAKFIENHGGNINKISVFGQDSNPTTWKMAQMNLGISYDSRQKPSILPFAALKPTSASLMRTRSLTIATLSSRQTSLWQIRPSISPAGVQINSLMMSVGSMVRLLLATPTSRGCST